MLERIKVSRVSQYWYPLASYTVPPVVVVVVVDAVPVRYFNMKAKGNISKLFIPSEHRRIDPKDRKTSDSAVLAGCKQLLIVVLRFEIK